jgi:hypothetical protein
MTYRRAYRLAFICKIEIIIHRFCASTTIKRRSSRPIELANDTACPRRELPPRRSVQVRLSHPRQSRRPRASSSNSMKTGGQLCQARKVWEFSEILCTIQWGDPLRLWNTKLLIFIKDGAPGRTRTSTPLRATDFESAASTVPPLGPPIARGIITRIALASTAEANENRTVQSQQTRNELLLCSSLRLHC